jgi:GntR family transcriptional regulator
VEAIGGEVDLIPHALSIRADPRPLYVLAETGLRNLIASSSLQPGDRLPPEPDLAKILGVSRSTIREALRNLELNGEVKRLHGVGTLVTRSRDEIAGGLERLESLEQLATRQGWVCGTVDLDIRAFRLRPKDARALDRPEGAMAVRICRAKTRDGRKIAFMEAVVPAEVMSVDEARSEFASSIIDTFLRRGRPRLDHARAHVRACTAPREVAEGLDVRRGSSTFVLEEVFYDDAGGPFCRNISSFLPGSMRLDLVRRPW